MKNITQLQLQLRW